LERTFAFPKSAKSFYSYWKEKIQPNHWQTQMDRLADGKTTWDQFFETATVAEHPALEMSTSKGGHSLLHLAVYQNREEWVLKLSHLLTQRKNNYGLNPLELATFLGRAGSIAILKDAGNVSLFKVPNLLIDDPDRVAGLTPFAYLNEPIFESVHTLDLVLEKTAHAKSRDQIPGEKIWMGIYFNKEVQKGLHQKIALRWINETFGFGIFAVEKIPSCTFIGEYTGVIKEAGLNTKDNYYCVQYTTWDIRRKKFVIDAKEAGNFTRFINHSKKPNLGLQSIYWCGLPRMVLVSLQEIEAGSQLSFDYGNLFWKECPHTPVPIE
jgi:hypothetical protein